MHSHFQRCEVAKIARQDRQAVQLRSRRNDQIWKSWRMTLPARSVRQSADKTSSRDVEDQNPAGVKVQHRFQPISKPPAFRSAPERRAFAIPSSISAIVTTERKRLLVCLTIHATSGDAWALARPGEPAEMTFVSTR